MNGYKKFMALPYLCVFILALACSFAFQTNGVFTMAAIILVYGLIPFLEKVVPFSPKLIEEEEEKALRNKKIFDILLYLTVLVQVFLLIQYLNRISSEQNTLFESVILTFTMGISCGVLGINVAHELGHRTTKHEQIMANVLLLTSLYMHFTIEHNKGHHKNVGTPDDPATARFNETLYAFWLRCIPSSFRSAWSIEKKELSRKKKSLWSINNKMIQYILIELGLIAVIAFFYGWQTSLFFIAAAVIGILHLETVNYIEHYGLSRKKVSERRFEKVMPWHSWNSNRPLGRLFLFELTLHSDHHYAVHKKYQQLQSMQTAPELPMGYPGAMLLSLIPGLWFRTMNPRALAALEQNHE